MLKRPTLAGLLIGWLSISANVCQSAELIQLNEKNFDSLCPRGKEPDAIYGDWILRNEHLVAVIAAPVATRNANMTVRNVGGMLIDFTPRGAQSDQLSCFYPGGNRFNFHSIDDVEVIVDGKSVPLKSQTRFEGRKLEVVLQGEPTKGKDSHAVIRYALGDGDLALGYNVAVENKSSKSIDLAAQDFLRCDGVTFKFGNDDDTRLFWAEDQYFNQAYGFLLDEGTYDPSKDNRTLVRVANRKSQSEGEKKADEAAKKLEPGQKQSWGGRLICSQGLPGLRSMAHAMRNQAPSQWYQLKLNASDGPVTHAVVEVSRGDQSLGTVQSDEEGWVRMRLEAGAYSLKIAPLARDTRDHKIEIGVSPLSESLTLTPATRIKTRIVDSKGVAIPAKIQVIGTDPTPSPNWGPDSADTAVRNLLYTANGQASAPLPPGKYTVIASHGPEYDAVTQTIELKPGQTATIDAQLVRSVDTTGWVSGEFHSHSSPSGDNISSQLGRVQNLLAENLEFAPCTEHNRVDTYAPHLQRLDATRLMATCTGIELTGVPLPVNHQNAFPMKRTPHVQDGGGPTPDIDPIIQIERLAGWDSGSDKVVQMNHPNLPQIMGDRDLDGKADDGFRRMLDVMDIVEIHPLERIFSVPSADAPVKERGENRCYYWMQLLNLGYRKPAVVNTDAHYNWHGSGWMRNYIASSTDDPAKITTEEMLAAIQRGRMVMTTAPFLQVELRSNVDGKALRAISGDVVSLKGSSAKLYVRVQCANWYDINRVQVFLNGRAVEELNFTRGKQPDKFAANTPVRFEAEIELPKMNEPTHVIVATIGESLTLGDVMGSEFGKMPPVAVSNPIFVMAKE